MGWMQKLINKHNHKEKCLICEKIVSDNAAVVEYRYADGVCKAFICDTCADEMDKTNIGDIDDAI